VLADPIGAGAGPAFDPPLESGLVAHLQDRAGMDVAGNHGRLAKDADDALEKPRRRRSLRILARTQPQTELSGRATADAPVRRAR
jgi:hypothetical protein